MNFKDLIPADVLKDMTLEQGMQLLESFNINVPEVLGQIETGLLNQARNIQEKTGHKILLVAEPNSTCDQIQVTIYRDKDGRGDLEPMQEFAFRNLLEILKYQPQPNTNITPHEEPQIKQIGSPDSGSPGTAAGGHEPTGAGSSTAAEPYAIIPTAD
jgi:hypothetical protein